MNRKSFLGSVVGLFAAAKIAAEIKPEEPAFKYQAPPEIKFNPPVSPYTIVLAHDDKSEIFKGRQFFVDKTQEDGIYGNYVDREGNISEYQRLKEKYYLPVCSATSNL